MHLAELYGRHSVDPYACGINLLPALNQQGYQLGLFSGIRYFYRSYRRAFVVKDFDAERTHPIRRADRHAVDQLVGTLRTRR